MIADHLPVDPMTSLLEEAPMALRFEKTSDEWDATHVSML